MQSKQAQAGFTMIELLVVLAIAAILAVLTAPSFAAFIKNTSQSSAMSQLTSDLNRARSEAIKRNARVLVCVPNPPLNPTQCGGTNWQTGWLVCQDINGNGMCDNSSAQNPNPFVIRQAINSNITMTGNLASMMGSQSSVYFNPDGSQGAGAAVKITLSGNPKWDGEKDKVVNIAATGNISTQ